MLIIGIGVPIPDGECFFDRDRVRNEEARAWNPEVVFLDRGLLRVEVEKVMLVTVSAVWVSLSIRTSGYTKTFRYVVQKSKEILRA